MINRLYTVTATATAVVVAPSVSEAEKLFQSGFAEIIEDSKPKGYVDDEVRSEDGLPEDWTVDCLPYGPRGNELTIGEFLDVLPPLVVRDTKTVDMFAATLAAGEKS